MRTQFGTALCMIAVGWGASATATAIAVAAPVRDRAAADLDWRRVATTADRGRIRGWRGAWIAALAQVDPQ